MNILAVLLAAALRYLVAYLRESSALAIDEPLILEPPILEGYLIIWELVSISNVALKPWCYNSRTFLMSLYLTVYPFPNWAPSCCTPTYYLGVSVSSLMPDRPGSKWCSSPWGWTWPSSFLLKMYWCKNIPAPSFSYKADSC